MTGTRFTTLAVLLLVVLLLAGCGGDDGVSPSVHDQTMADLEQAQQDLMDAEGERDQAQQDLMDAEGERDQAQQDLMDAEGERDQAQQDLMDAEGERDQAQQDLMDAEGERDQAQQDLMDAQDDADMQQAMADSAAAKELLNMALVNVLVDTDTTAEGLQPAAPSVALEVSTDGVLTASAAGYAMADMPPDMIAGWRGAMLTSGGDTAVVYTDIGNDGTQSLLDRYESTRPTGGAPRMWTVTLVNAAGDPETAGQIPWSSVMRPDDSSSFSGPAGATHAHVHGYRPQHTRHVFLLCRGIQTRAVRQTAIRTVRLQPLPAPPVLRLEPGPSFPMRALRPSRTTWTISSSAGGSTRAPTACRITCGLSPTLRA